MLLLNLAFVATLLALEARAAPSEMDVAFDGPNLRRSSNFATVYIEEPVLRLTGRYAVPEGSGPFPAVVHLHGCAGAIPPRDEAWVQRFSSWGFAVLRLDSLGPRGKDKMSVCVDPDTLSSFSRAVDAYAAKDWLSRRPEIDPSRIVLAGWSHGGSAVLAALGAPPTDFRVPKGTKPFLAGIAFYPYCVTPSEVQVPILILVGDRDTWTPADLCRALAHHPKIRVEVYPDAHQGFDIPGADHILLGHRIRYSPEAEAAAVSAVKTLIGGLVP